MATAELSKFAGILSVALSQHHLSGFEIAFRYDLNQISYDYTGELRNRFKGLDLIDRVPEELWIEIRDTVQEAGTKIIPKEKKSKKVKWLSEEVLQRAVNRKEAKGKGEKEPFGCRVPNNSMEIRGKQ